MNSADGQNPHALQRDDRGAIAVLTLNRPAKLNALSNELLSAIVCALDDIELDPLGTQQLQRTTRVSAAGIVIERHSFHRLDSPPDALFLRDLLIQHRHNISARPTLYRIQMDSR